MSIPEKDRHVKRTPRIKCAPKRDYPLLYNPRPLVECGGLGSDDARWRNVNSKPLMLGGNLQIVNRTRVHEMQQRKRTK